MKDDMLCLSSIDWDFMWQGHQEIMARYAAQGHRVLFIENTGARTPRLRDAGRLWRRWQNWRRGVYGVREERPNLFIYSPLGIPLPHSRLAGWVNRWLLWSVVRRWMKAFGFSQPIVWTFLPTRLTLDLLDRIDYRLLIYYCIDRFTASSSEARKIAHTEAELLRRSHLVFVTSQALYEHCAPQAQRIHLFPFGVDLSTFHRADGQPLAPPEDVQDLPRPIVGYVGGLHQWVDQELLRSVAMKRPEYSFVLVGPAQTNTEALQQLPNVRAIGQRSHDDLPRYIQMFDVAIIPYRITEYTRHVFPTKLPEYLAMGKPVVSTALPEVERFNQEFGPLVRVGQDADRFDHALARALAEPHGQDGPQRRQAAIANSWEVRMEQMAALIADALARTQSGNEQHWRQRMRTLVRSTRRRFIRILVPLLAIWLVMFHTPLLWWVAAPLHINEPAHAADTIVVLAGGVGESGRAGQGYEERVQHAVRLYHQGFAPTLIFSSGYIYAMKEARVMQALAVSLGVPRDAIYLDEAASGTYQNVLLSTQLMRQQRFTSALVVSSPFHMQRVRLVWQKQAPDMAATWTPVQRNRYFGHRTTVLWRHWRAIVHEYAAIAYYWWRGWV